MRTPRSSIFAVSLVAALVGVEAEARRDTPLALLGMPSILESSGHAIDRKVVRFGLGGDIETGTVGVGAVAADAATRIKYLDSDIQFASDVAGLIPGSAFAFQAPELPRMNLEVQEKVRFHEMLAIGHGQAGQELADEAEAMILSLATLPGRGENRMKRADSQSELACLTEAIYFEARGESINGQIAVGEVILTRVDHPRFPSTVCGVIKQGSQNLNSCQFSYKCDGDPERMTNRKAKKRAADVAILLMKGERRQLSGNATHYHADYVDPYWASSLQKTATVGTHLFYKRRSRRASR